MNKTDRGLLIGMALGDGCISVATCYTTDPKTGKRYPYTKSVIKLKHSIKQLAYMEHKQKLLLSIFGGKANKIGHFFQTAFGKRWEMLQLSKNNPYFRVMKKYLYPAGKKTISRQVLDWLTHEGLALWLMDDGNCITNKNKEGKVTSFTFRLSTHVPEEEADTIVEWFSDKYRITVKKYEVKPGQWNIRWNTTSHRQLTYILKDYIIPFMYYKFPDLQEQERNLATDSGE